MLGLRSLRSLLVGSAVFLLATAAAAEQPSPASTGIMKQFIATATASPERVQAESRVLQGMYEPNAMHLDAIFVLRGPAEIAGFARIASGITPTLTPLPSRGLVHQTHYRYRLGGRFQVDHIVGTEHRLSPRGRVHLQREFLDLQRWSSGVPGGSLVLRTRVGRNLLRFAANYGIQKSLEKQGSVPERSTLSRMKLALSRAKTSARHHEGPTLMQRAKDKMKQRRAARQAARRAAR